MRPAGAAHEDYRRTRFFPSLDGLRCVSILAVMAFHAFGVESGRLLAKGYLGVSLFFTISGFLITTLLLREHAVTGTISLRRFYLRRVLRIFPLYYAVLGLYVVLVWWMERDSPEGQQFFQNLPAFLTLTSNWFVPLYDEGHYRIIFVFAWSLATEEQFYLIWPLVLWAGRGGWSPVAFLVGMIALPLGVGWAVEREHLDPQGLGTRIVQGIALPIYLGCLGAYLLHWRRSFELVWRVLGHAWSAPLAVVLLLASLLVERIPYGAQSLAMAVLVIACCIRQDHPLAPVLTQRAVVYVGTISYGLYLLHMLALNVTRLLVPGPGGLLTFLVMLAIATLAAGLSYRFFERPFLALKGRLAWDAVERPRREAGAAG